MLSVTNVSMPESIQSALQERGRELRKPVWQGPLLGIALVLAIVVGAMVIVDLAFRIFDRGNWITFGIGAALVLAIVGLPQIRSLRRQQRLMADMASGIDVLAAAPIIKRYDLEFGVDHWFIEHEHGVIVVTPAGPDTTLYLDLSSVADDVRYDDWLRRGRIFRSRWTWFEGGPLGYFDFRTEGEAFTPRWARDAKGKFDDELGGDVFEFLDSPGDGDVVARPFAEVDRFVHARLDGVESTRDSG
jgi:hypothetical protein